MGYECKILADSVSPAGVRLTTFEVSFPRFLLAEWNTHRALCLAGDSMLEFDLPGGTKGGDRRVFTMRLDEFVDKWLNGARRVGAKPKRACDLSWVEPSAWYSSHEVAARVGASTPSNIHAQCRSGTLTARRGADGRAWEILGQSIIDWRTSKPEHTRYDMRERLRVMRIRQLDEATGKIVNSNVIDAMESGEKEVFEVRAGEYRVAGSADHRVMTLDGWKRIGDLSMGDRLVVRKWGKADDDKEDGLRLKKVDGQWRSVWQRKIGERLKEADPMCRDCGVELGRDVHHIVSVHQDQAQTFDEDNVTLLCTGCHKAQHKRQGWQGGTYLYGGLAKVDEIVLRGVEMTYDLTIGGEYPNFLANGVVVHNSRNAASSRAIPVRRRLLDITADPVYPVEWGVNKRGMQATDVLDAATEAEAEAIWREAMNQACLAADRLDKLDPPVHKQVANRIAEGYAWIDVVATATEWGGFFAQRAHPDAQPEFRVIAELMQAAYRASEPERRGFHLPYVDAAAWAWVAERAGVLDERAVFDISTGRCARVSYKTFSGDIDPHQDLRLARDLKRAAPPHASPFEHPCEALADPDIFCGNVRGWCQHRHRALGGRHMKQVA